MKHIYLLFLLRLSDIVHGILHYDALRTQEKGICNLQSNYKTLDMDIRANETSDTG